MARFCTTTGCPRLTADPSGKCSEHRGREKASEIRAALVKLAEALGHKHPISDSATEQFNSVLHEASRIVNAQIQRSRRDGLAYNAISALAMELARHIGAFHDDLFGIRS